MKEKGDKNVQRKPEKKMHEGKGELVPSLGSPVILCLPGTAAWCSLLHLIEERKDKAPGKLHL